MVYENVDLCNRLDRLFSLGTKIRPRLAKACFARILDEAYRTGDDKSRASFGVAVGDIISSMGVNTDYLDDEDTTYTAQGKRQPTIRESLYATTRLYETVGELEKTLSGLGSAALYGGSLSYGPFFNVRGGTGSGASDIDLIVAMHDQETLTTTNKDSLTHLMSDQDAEELLVRLERFGDLYVDQKATLLSKKFFVDNEIKTEVSAHFIPTNSLLSICDPEQVALGGEEWVLRALDYKEKPFGYSKTVGSDSSGHLAYLPVESFPMDRGYVSNIPISSGLNGRYIKGLYQNVVIPSSFAYSHNEDINRLVNGFEGALEKRVDQERERFDADASIVKCHPRFVIMPPRIPEDVLAKIW